MNRLTRKNAVIILLFSLGAFLRLWNLGSLSSGFFRDEAALGYNAYSIWLTGKDEFGYIFPIVFRSFEVFFLPLYVYISSPLVGILGLNEFTSRLLSSLSGMVALYFAYMIGKKVWNKDTGILCLFTLAISPWHIFYSRGAFEGNLALTFFTAGFYYWITFLKTKSGKTFFVSALLFALSMYSYQSERFIVPFFAVLALMISFKDLWKLKNKLIAPLIFLFILLLPLVVLSFNAGGYHRVVGVSIFAKSENPPGWIEGQPETILLNNKLFLRGKQLISLYTSYFSPRNLFFEGDSEKQRSVENSSVFYGSFLLFLVVGLLTLAKKANAKEKMLLIFMFLGPIPASLTSDPFHTYRSLMLFMPLSLIIGKGIFVTYMIVKKFTFASSLQDPFRKRNVLGNIFLTILVGISAVNLSLFLYSYAVLSQVTRASFWDYGYKDLVSYIEMVRNDKKVIVDDPSTEAYIHFLFFGKW